MIDSGLSIAIINATSKYCAVTTAKNSPASTSDNIIILSNGFLSSIMPIVHIICSIAEILFILI